MWTSRSFKLLGWALPIYLPPPPPRPPRKGGWFFCRLGHFSFAKAVTLSGLVQNFPRMSEAGPLFLLKGLEVKTYLYIRTFVCYIPFYKIYIPKVLLWYEVIATGTDCPKKIFYENMIVCVWKFLPPLPVPAVRTFDVIPRHPQLGGGGWCFCKIPSPIYLTSHLFYRCPKRK